MRFSYLTCAGFVTTNFTPLAYGQTCGLGRPLGYYGIIQRINAIHFLMAEITGIEYTFSMLFDIFSSTRLIGANHLYSMKRVTMNFLQLRALDKNPRVDLGLLILRIGAAFLVFHGIDKLSDIAGTAGFFTKASPITATAPTFWAVIIGLGQLVLPLMILFGLFTRWAAILIVVMFVGIAFVELGAFKPEGIAWIGKSGGIGFEGSLPYLIPGIVLFLTGAGKYSLDYKLGSQVNGR